MILNIYWCTRASDERRTTALVVTRVILQCPLRWQGLWHTWKVQAESKSTGATFLTHLRNNQLRIKQRSVQSSTVSFISTADLSWILLGTCFGCLLPYLYRSLDWFRLIWIIGAGSQIAAILWRFSLSFFLYNDRALPGSKFSARHSSMH